MSEQASNQTRKLTNNKANTQAIKHSIKQSNKQTSEQTNKWTSEEAIKRRQHLSKNVWEFLLEGTTARAVNNKRQKRFSGPILLLVYRF